MNERLMPSRKAAALLWACLAVFLASPSVGAWTPGFQTPEECIDEDQTGGTGGQSVRCTFHCPAPAGTVSIDVRADDKDATVSGTATCPGGAVHCDGKKSCSDDGTYESEGAGACSADSDEWFDSGLYVWCGANEAGTHTCTPASCEPTQWCPITEPVEVCIDPSSVVPERYADRLSHLLEQLGDPELLCGVIRGFHNDASIHDRHVAEDVVALVQAQATDLLPMLAVATSLTSWTYMQVVEGTAIGLTVSKMECQVFTPVIVEGEGFQLRSR